VVAILDPYEAVVKDNSGAITVGSDFIRRATEDAVGVYAVAPKPSEGFRPRTEVRIIIVGNATR
jgi:hypothetical protein